MGTLTTLAIVSGRPDSSKNGSRYSPLDREAAYLAWPLSDRVASRRPRPAGDLGTHMTQVVTLWLTSASPETGATGADDTDGSPFVRFVSATDPRFEPSAPSTTGIGESPLDDVTAAGLAARFAIEEIRHRIERCVRYASRPGAGLPNVEAVRDWRMILETTRGWESCSAPHDGPRRSG